VVAPEAVRVVVCPTQTLVGLAEAVNVMLGTKVTVRVWLIVLQEAQGKLTLQVYVLVVVGVGTVTTEPE